METAIRFEHGESIEVPAGFWCVLAGAFFAVQPMITLGAVDVLGLDAQTGSALRIALTVCLLMLVWMMSVRTAARVRFPVPVRWAGLFVVLAACSFLWSEAVSPLASAGYWVGTACNFGIALLLLRNVARGEAARSMMKGFVAGAVAVAVAAWLMPAQADMRLGDEEYFNSNTIAYICSFAAFFAQFLMGKRGAKWIVVEIFLIATILRSLSKTTIVAFFLAETWVLIQDRSMQRRTKIVLVASGMMLALALSGLFLAYLNLYTSYGDQLETLTGRTAIWAWAVHSGLERPWLGHGFDAMWKVAPVFGVFEARHAENEVLQQFYAFGAAGLVVLAGYYASLWRTIYKAIHQPRRMILCGVVLFVVVRGIAEAEPFDLLLPVWMAVLLACAACEVVAGGNEAMKSSSLAG